MSARPILVIGSTGKTGSRITQRLESLAREPRDFGDFVRDLAASWAWVK